MADHEALAYWTAGVFGALSVWRWKVPAGRGRRVFLGAWFAAAGLLAATAFHGGELVFKFGVGVAR